MKSASTRTAVLITFCLWLPALIAQSFAPVTALQTRAEQLEQKGRPDLAVQVWKQIILADPSNKTAREHLSGDERDRNAADGNAIVSPATVARSQRSMTQPMAAAYRALQQKNTLLAEQRFHAILLREAGNISAMRGLGYAAMQQQDFSSALHWLELAQRHGGNNAGVRRAIDTSHYWLDIQQASAAIEQHQLDAAEGSARAALRLHPGDPQTMLMLARIEFECNQTSAAMELYRQVAEGSASPPNAEGWSGWLKASAVLQQPQGALAALDHLSSATRAGLQQNFEFLVGLSDAFAGAGRTKEAEQALGSALALPENSASTVRRKQVELQYAALCIRDRHYNAAEQLYRGMLNRDARDEAAWQTLIRVEHVQGHDAEAWKTYEQMPASQRTISNQDVPFLRLLAAIQQSEKNYATARDLLLTARKQLDAEGKQAPADLLRQQADLEVQLDHPDAAIPLYREALTGSPEDAEGWTGYLTALHRAGEDKQAHAVQRQMPVSVVVLMESNPVLAENYFQTMASVEQSLGDLNAALDWTKRLQAQGGLVSNGSSTVDIELQEGWLEYTLHQDAAAEATAQHLRSGAHAANNISDTQREQIASLTANLAVRRATRLTAQGRRQQAIQVLDGAARQVGSDSKARIRLATGYLSAGEPAASIAIYQSVDMRIATVGDMKAAIGAAIETQQKNLAQEWLAHTLASYPDDPGLLLLAGEFAQSNGNLLLSEKYLRAARAASKRANQETSKENISIERRAANLLTAIESGYSGWLGATAYVNHVIGNPGTTQLTDVEIPAEASFFVRKRFRLTAIERAVYLTSGAYPGTPSQPLGTLAANTVAAATPMTGFGGELQIAMRSVAASVGVTPAGFPVMNVTGAVMLHGPRNPWMLSFTRDSIRESQLAYGGLHDPAAPANIWGGVVANLGTVQYARGNARSGEYATVSTGAVTGKHVQTNPEITGDAGAYWQLWARPETSFKLGVNFYGQHNAHNELFYSYGHGGYFSPEYFLLPAVPLTLNGHHGSRLQYEVAGSLGPQIYKEASAPGFPLDAGLQAARGNPIYPSQSTLGLNYGVHGKVDRVLGEHWRLGVFFSANNSDKYNQQVGGMSLHYLFRAQQSSAFHTPESFPHSGLRPYLVP